MGADSLGLAGIHGEGRRGLRWSRDTTERGTIGAALVFGFC
jgi:hypothetical protein